MKETLIYKLDKHSIYYVANDSSSFYIFIPHKDYKETNIALRLKSNYELYDLRKNSKESIIKELVNYYTNLDNYNVTLILPVFYDDLLTRIRTVDDLEIYQKLDSYLGQFFNAAYNLLNKNGIKVNSNIYIINNDTFKKFTNWFVSRYNNRIEYKTVLDLVRQNGSYNSYDMVETPNINFVVGKNKEPSVENTAEIEVETFDSYNKDNDEQAKENIDEEKNGGFISYILLGAITFIVSMFLLYVFVK